MKLTWRQARLVADERTECDTHHRDNAAQLQYLPTWARVAACVGRWRAQHGHKASHRLRRRSTRQCCCMEQVSLVQRLLAG